MSTPSTAAAGSAPRAPGAPIQPLRLSPLHGPALLLGTMALSLATFMNVLDSSIANVAIPAISGDLGVSPTQGTWVITSFGVANAISVPWMPPARKSPATTSAATARSMANAR